MTGEEALLARVAAALGEVPRGAEVELGIGDDCAVLRSPGSRLVWTVDAQVDEVHFRREWLSYEDIGYRAFASAASDVVAMGATPIAALAALTLDPRTTEADVEALARGQRDASREASAPVIGGNLSRGATLSVTTTVLGRAVAPVRREGARPGDLVWATGPLGLVRLGLLSYMLEIDGENIEPARQCFRRPRVRYDLAGWLGGATAAIDVSDGLALDASRLAARSGVRLVLDAEALVACGGRALEVAARRLGERPLEAALRGGEDYVVLACAPSALVGVDGALPGGLVAIGRVQAGAGVAVVVDGREREVEAAGYDHLRGA